LFFETNLEKNIWTPYNKLFWPKEERKKNKKTKKLLQSYTPCLNSQSVKTYENNNLPTAAFQ